MRKYGCRYLSVAWTYWRTGVRSGTQMPVCKAGLTCVSWDSTTEAARTRTKRKRADLPPGYGEFAMDVGDRGEPDLWRSPFGISPSIGSSLSTSCQPRRVERYDEHFYPQLVLPLHACADRQFNSRRTALTHTPPRPASGTKPVVLEGSKSSLPSRSCMTDAVQLGGRAGCISVARRVLNMNKCSFAFSFL